MNNDIQGNRRVRGIELIDEVNANSGVDTPPVPLCRVSRQKSVLPARLVVPDRAAYPNIVHASQALLPFWCKRNSQTLRGVLPSFYVFNQDELPESAGQGDLLLDIIVERPVINDYFPPFNNRQGRDAFLFLLSFKSVDLMPPQRLRNSEQPLFILYDNVINLFSIPGALVLLQSSSKPYSKDTSRNQKVAIKQVYWCYHDGYSAWIRTYAPTRLS
ncbi:hypothetical protein EDD85DRAFT_943159 [Armillaria nabsnona]|nr:hypothetical protein EDD85DRAFT_943159 [Armillaria nabsnona]